MEQRESSLGVLWRLLTASADFILSNRFPFMLLDSLLHLEQNIGGNCRVIFLVQTSSNIII